MNPASSGYFHVEPLGDRHDRESFSCGVPELDKYLLQQAGQDARRRIAAPFVLLDHAGAIAGYYTLSAYAIRVTELPADIAKKLPRYPMFPATLLGRLAISREYQGKKLGQMLLMDALQRSLRSTTQVASAGIVVDAIDERARLFYLHHEFISLPDHPNRLFIAMRTIEKLFRD